MTRGCDDHPQADHDPPTAENAEFSAAAERLQGAGGRVDMGDIVHLPVGGRRGRLRDPGDDALVEEWLAGLSPPTARAYRGDLVGLRAFLASRGVGLLGAGRADLGAWVAHLRSQGHAETTVRRRLSAASGLYAWLVGSGVLACSPVSGLARPRGGPAPRLGPGRGELARLLEVARGRGRREELLVRLMCVCGLRVSEAVGLDAADVSCHEGRMLLEVRRKGGRHELVGVPEETARLLLAQVAEQGAGRLLRSRGGRRLSVRGARLLVGILGEEAGISGLHPHLLRHAYVTQALSAGVPLAAVAAGAGHRDIRVTLGYAQALAQAGAAAASAVERRVQG